MAPKPRTGAIDDAEAWIIAEQTATYAATALRFGIEASSLRNRIKNKHGSLPEARLAWVIGEVWPEARTIEIVRRCFRCGVSSRMHRNHRMCAGCQKEVNSMGEWG